MQGTEPCYERVVTQLFTRRKNLGLVQIKSICRRQINVNEKLKFGLGRVEKHCRKRRKCWLPAFSPFQCNVFKSPLFQGRQKSGLCGKDLRHIETQNKIPETMTGSKDLQFCIFGTQRTKHRDLKTQIQLCFFYTMNDRHNCS